MTYPATQTPIVPATPLSPENPTVYGLNDADLAKMFGEVEQPVVPQTPPATPTFVPQIPQAPQPQPQMQPQVPPQQPQVPPQMQPQPTGQPNRLLAGRYMTVEELERGYQYQQSQHDLLKNSTKQASELQNLVDTTPGLGDHIVNFFGDDNPGSKGDDFSDVIGTDEVGAQQIDPVKLQQKIATQIQAGIQQGMAEVKQSTELSTRQMQEEAQIRENYRAAGRTDIDYQADVQFAQVLSRMPRPQMMEMVHKLRLVEASQVPADPNPNPAPTIVNVPGMRNMPISEEQVIQNQIANGGTGRKSYAQVRHEQNQQR